VTVAGVGIGDWGFGISCHRPQSLRIPNPQSPIPSLAAALALTVATSGAACGRKGPPLPPLVKVPAPAADFTAERHGSVVDIQFTIPAANTDGSRPANIERVDVYALTTVGSPTEDNFIKQGTRVASIPVKAPRDPNQTIESDEPEADMVAPEGQGVDQGTVAHARERLTADMRQPIDLAAPKKPAREAEEETGDRPLAPRVLSPIDRLYVAVGITTRGRRGRFSKPVAVVMADSPRPPAPPTIDYDERAVTITWQPVGTLSAIQSAAAPGVLPSRPIGAVMPTIAYNVYEVATPEGSATPTFTRLTPKPVQEPHFSDPRITWNAMRCYAVRAVETFDDRSIESEETPPACKTLIDRFPPAPPKGLTPLASEGAINLVWEPNTERDLAGYIVLRGIEPAETLEPITAAPIQETQFHDNVKPGVRFVYAVKAVDTSGNESAPSARVTETAR